MTQQEIADMSDREAYDCLANQLGGELGMTMIREMIHTSGVDKTVENTLIVYKRHNGEILPNLEDWIRRAFQYIQGEMSKSFN